MRFLVNLSLLAASALAAVLPTDIAKINTQIISPQLAPGTEVYLPPDPNFPIKFTQRHSSFANPSYSLAVQPLTIQDLSTVVSHLAV